MNAPRDSKGTGDTQNKYSQSNAIVVYSPLPYTSDNEMVRTKWNDSILAFLNGLHKRKSHGSIKSRLCHLRTHALKLFPRTIFKKRTLVLQ